MQRSKDSTYATLRCHLRSTNIEKCQTNTSGQINYKWLRFKGFPLASSFLEFVGELKQSGSFP